MRTHWPKTHLCRVITQRLDVQAAEATDEADDDNYFAVLDQAGNAAEAAAAEIQDLRRPVRGVGHTPQTVLARRARRASAMRFGHFEGIQVFLNLGTPGILILIFLANCIVGTAVWLWRKI